MKNKTVVIIGCAILLLAVLIILGSIFLPRLSAKKEMRALLRDATAEDPVYMIVGDPKYETGDLLGNDGKEVRLSQEQMIAVQDLLGVMEEDFSFAGSEKKLQGAWDKYLIVKSAEGDTIRIYVTEKTVYYLDGTVAHSFASEDEKVHGALYAKLEELLK